MPSKNSGGNADTTTRLFELFLADVVGTTKEFADEVRRADATATADLNR